MYYQEFELVITKDMIFYKAIDTSRVARRLCLAGIVQGLKVSPGSYPG